MNSDKDRILKAIEGYIFSIAFDNENNKTYIVATDEGYVKCKVEDKEVIIIEKYLTEEEWKKEI
jgi:hypothetical protein